MNKPRLPGFSKLPKNIRAGATFPDEVLLHSQVIHRSGGLQAEQVV